jgi:uncharacterized protein YdhG (YjbR/CyaY superfamily)
MNQRESRDRVAATEHSSSVDEYIRSFPEDVQTVLEQVRQSIRRAAPGTQEKMSYRMPAFTLGGSDLIHVGAWKSHLSLYPASTTNDALRRELAPYRTGKGTLRFPLRRPIPHQLIERLVEERVKQRSDHGGGG